MAPAMTVSNTAGMAAQADAEGGASGLSTFCMIDVMLPS
jgi:hypothetical protein